MSSNWNFRSILDVYPEADSFTCVSIKPDNSARCHNRRPLLSDIDLSEAASLLDIMDHCKSLKTSFRYLDDLARLTLCVVHSEVGDDQVELIIGQWKERIMDALHVEVEIPAARPRSRRLVDKRRTLSTTVMTVLEEEKEEPVYCPGLLWQPLANINQSPTVAKNSGSSSMWTASVARQSSNKSTKSRSIRNMSRKISPPISQDAFQDASNEQLPTSREQSNEPTRVAP
jgi:hypothetical protein